MRPAGRRLPIPVLVDMKRKPTNSSTHPVKERRMSLVAILVLLRVHCLFKKTALMNGFLLPVTRLAVLMSPKGQNESRIVSSKLVYSISLFYQNVTTHKRS